MRHRTFMAACTLSLLLSATSQAQRGTSGGQWPNHSGDKGSTKYAPLDQINRSNVRNLHVAWRRPAVADELIRSFGEAGKVDLRTGLGPQPQPFNFTSAPLIVKDIAVIGSSIADNPNVKEGTRGDVRGYEIKTGKLRWTFRTIPREREFGVETWEDRAWEYTGAVNAWSNLSADEELGYIYLPLTSPTSDMYGGARPRAKLFSRHLR